MIADHKTLVNNFITAIWNNQQFDEIDNYLDPNFIDHSLPENLPTNKEGTKLWIMSTGKSFEHKTIIEEIVAEDDKVMIKFKMHLKHIGTWRDIKPTNAEIYTIGYRYFKISNGKILAHWALLDGNSIENQLRNSAHGCKIQN
jgi:predicted ester cyclase